MKFLIAILLSCISCGSESILKQEKEQFKNIVSIEISSDNFPKFNTNKVTLSTSIQSPCSGNNIEVFCNMDGTNGFFIVTDSCEISGQIPMGINELNIICGFLIPFELERPDDGLIDPVPDF